MPSSSSQRLIGRDTDEVHRGATPLELLYDLIFVVAIASLASSFHHGFAEGHIRDSLVSFLIVFLAIWWAWNQYSWFASSFDNDSVSFRSATMWQMVGALVLAAGVERAFEGDFSVLVVGYVIIRSSSVLMWVKVAIDNPALRTTAGRYATGIFLIQIGWIAQQQFAFSYFVLAGLWAAEFFVPYYAESHTQTSYHSSHIEERFGLLTIIVLGESILASTGSLQTLIDDFSTDILLLSIGCLLTLFGAWWLYFDTSIGPKLREKDVAFLWGYGHYVIFGSAAAIGALVSVNVDVLTDHAEVSLETAQFGFAVAVALYLTGIWFCHDRIVASAQVDRFFLLGAAAAVLLLGAFPHSVFSVGILIAAAVVYRQVRPLQFSLPPG